MNSGANKSAKKKEEKRKKIKEGKLKTPLQRLVN